MSKRVWEWFWGLSEEAQGVLVIGSATVACFVALWLSGSLKDRPVAHVEVTSEGLAMESDLLKALHQNEATKGGRMGSRDIQEETLRLKAKRAWEDAQALSAKDAEIERLKRAMNLRHKDTMKLLELHNNLEAENATLKAQLAASEAKRKVLAKFYKTGERYVEARHNQDDMHNAGYFSAQAAYAQAKLDIDATSALEAP